MTPLTQRLEAASSQFEAIFSDGKVTIMEIFSTLELLSKCVKDTIAELPEKPTEAEIKTMLDEAWQWADEKYSLVQKADDAIKLPLLLEAFDSMLIEMLVEQTAIPALAKKLAA